VETLEELMADTLRVVRATSLQVDRLSQEMRAFKEEMRAFKEETRIFKDEMGDFKDEMSIFKDEMSAFREEERASRKEMNKRWGDLSASLGMLVENIVAPSVPRVLREVFGCPDEEIESLFVRLRRKHPTRRDHNREFDTIAAGCGYVLIVESKTQLNADAVGEFADRLPEAKEYLPEFAERGYRFVGVVAGLYVDPSVVAFAERRGLIVLGTGEDLMEVLNSPGFVPRSY